MLIKEKAHRFAVAKERLWELACFEGALHLDVAAHFGELTVVGEGVGATRTFATPAGDIVEILDMLDEARLCYSFSVLDAGPLPFANYTTFIRVCGAGGDASLLYYRTTFHAVGASDAEALQAETNNVELYVEMLEQALAGGG